MRKYIILAILIIFIFHIVLNIQTVLAQPDRIKLATTTSTDNSGLLEVLLPPFEEMFGLRVDVIAVGTGKALKLGENGEVDLVLVHAREAEDKFIENGFGINRRDVMYNDFIIIGPEKDPALIKGKSAVVSLQLIQESNSNFASRGDDSGTHKKEIQLWNEAGIEPEGSWYLQTGQGMGPTVLIANEKQGYCLIDRGTYLAYRDKLDLVILSEGDQRLFNPYGIIAVNPALHPHVNYVYAMAFIGWLTSPEGQDIIGNFKKHGEVLFHPNAPGK